MAEHEQRGEMDVDKGMEDSLPPIPWTRKVWSGVIVIFFFDLALVMLVRNLIEGGAFVSLFTVGLVLAGLFLVNDRITQVTLWGHEIKLQREQAIRLNRETEEELNNVKEMIGSLRKSQATSLQTLLALTSNDPFVLEFHDSFTDNRAASVISVCEQIDDAGLLPELSETIIFGTADVIAKLKRVIRKRPNTPQWIKDGSDPFLNSHAPGEDAIEDEKWLDYCQAVSTSGHPWVESVPAEQLRRLLEYKIRALAYVSL